MQNRIVFNIFVRQPSDRRKRIATRNDFFPINRNTKTRFAYRKPINAQIYLYAFTFQILCPAAHGRTARAPCVRSGGLQIKIQKEKDEDRGGRQTENRQIHQDVCQRQVVRNGQGTLSDTAQTQRQTLRRSSPRNDRPRDAHRFDHLRSQRHQSGNHRLQTEGPHPRQVHADRHHALPLRSPRAPALRQERPPHGQGHQPQLAARHHHVVQFRLLQPRQFGAGRRYDQVLRRGQRPAGSHEQQQQRPDQHHRKVQERRLGHRPDQGVRGQRHDQVVPLLLGIGQPAGSGIAQEGRADDHEGDAHDPVAARGGDAAASGR